MSEPGRASRDRREAASSGALRFGRLALLRGKEARGGTRGSPHANAPGKIRTCDLCLRRAALYPLSYGRGSASVAAVPLYLSETDVASLLTPADALPVLEDCFRRLASGACDNRPRARLPLEDGYFAVMAATDCRARVRGPQELHAVAWEAAFVVCLFELATGTLAAVIEADLLGRIRTGAASGVAARHLAREGAPGLGVIGCGWQAASQVAAIRAAVPSLGRVVAYCRTPEKLAAFCERTGAEPGESHRDAAEQDVVVTATTSTDPSCAESG